MLDGEIARLEEQAAGMLAGDRGYAAIRQLPGIGPVLGAVIAAEIGDITRFRNPGQLASWAGLTPRHYESDTRVIRGHVSKQGSRMLRWAVVEAIQRQPAGTRPRQVKDAIIARRGADVRGIAKTAAARITADPGVLRPARRAHPPRHQPGSVSCRPGRARGREVLCSPPHAGTSRRRRRERKCDWPRPSLDANRPMPPGQPGRGTPEGMKAASRPASRTAGDGAPITA